MTIDAVCIGDSIAVGINTYLPCVELRAVSGASSSKIIDLAPGVWHKVCVISAGSNDLLASGAANPNLADNLKHIRNQSNCEFYVWIEPANSIVASVVAKEAAYHSDNVVTFTPSSDGVHPASSKTLAGSILSITGN